MKKSANKILIVNAEYVLTMDAQRRIIRDGALLIEDGLIKLVGKTRSMEIAADIQVIDAQHMVVTPGFINGHCHISYAHATRGIFPDDLGPSYLSKVFKLQSSMTEEEEKQTSLLAITELLSYGTTTILDPGSTKHIESCLESYEEAGIRIVTGMQVVTRKNPYNMPVYTPEEALEATEEFIKAYDGALNGRVKAWAMPFSPDYVDRNLLTKIKGLSDDLKTGVTLHINNVGPPSKDSELASSINDLEEIGFAGSNVVLAHCVGIESEGIRSLARTGTCVITCPTNVVKNGGGYGVNFPLSELLELEVPVGLGTDAGNNSNLLETNRSMYLAAVLAKDGTGDITKVPAESALELATIAGAKALGLDSEIGSLEPGKKADIVLYDTMRPEWRTLFNPVNSLVYNADGRSVHTVLVEGRIVVENYTPTFVDTEELIRNVQKIGKGMLDRNDVDFKSKWPIS